MLHNIENAKRATNILFVAGFLLIVCIIFYYNSKDINLKIAYNGYGPQDYVAQKLNPENFKRDFAPGMLLIYDHSLPMRAYYYLAKYCGISPSVTIYPYMFIQTLLFLLSVAFITQTLFKDKFVTFISVILISVGNSGGLDLARFFMGAGQSVGYPLFYGYAFAFTFLSISFYLRNNYLGTFIFLSLAFYSHINMGLFTLAFICFYMLYKPRIFRDKSVIAGILIFLILVLPHIMYIMLNTAILSESIPVDQWVKSTRIFSVHWYPITMKLFTGNSQRELFPFLLICIFFFVALKYQDVKDEKNVKIIVGSIACMIMGIVGVVFSDIYPIPFLIKISPQRATGLVSFFGVLFIIYYILRKIDSGSIITVFLATFSLLIFVFSKPGIAVLPLFLLLFVDIREGWFGPIKISSDKIKVLEIFYYIATLLILSLTLICIFKDNYKIANSIYVRLWTPFQYFNPFSSYDFLLRGGGLKISNLAGYLIIGTIVISTGVILFRNASKRKVSTLLSILLALSLTIVWLLERDSYMRWHNREAEIASSYMAVQLWAKNNTPIDSLFMLDPSHHYGWRDFSERSSFGNLREWGYCAIAYNPDYTLYRKGLERIHEFGIDYEKIEEKNIYSGNSIYGLKLANDVRAKFYNINEEQIKYLSNKYSIDYILMNKQYHKNSFHSFKIAYENKYYTVYNISI